MTGFKEENTAEAKKKIMNKSLAAVRGSYCEFYKYQNERSFRSEVFNLHFGVWDIMIFMFLGMAFFKSGILLGLAPTKIYWWLFIGGLGLGLIPSYFRLQPIID